MILSILLGAAVVAAGALTYGSWRWRSATREMLARLEAGMEAALQETLVRQFMASVQKKKYEEMMGQVLNRNMSPYEAVARLLNNGSPTSMSNHSQE